MKKKILSFIVALSMLSALVLVPLPASAVTSGDYTYTVNDDGTATITGYNGNDADVTVPAEIDGHTVTVIGNRAFYENKIIKKVILPDTVETIDTYAFSGTTLENIKLSNNLKVIEEYAFLYTKLTYINLPTSVTTVKRWAFNVCFDLAYLRIPHTVTSIYEGVSNFICDKDLLVIVGCANSAAQAFAEAQGITFATIPCKDHTYSSGACTCCEILLGDLNKDGVVNNADYTILTGYVNDPSTCPDLSIADVNQDGVLDINDRLFLLEIISGVSTWPV